MKRTILAMVMATVAASGLMTAHADHVETGKGFGTEPCFNDTDIMPGSSGGIHHVYPDAENTIAPLQAAVTAAAEGDHIIVHNGTYTGQVRVLTPGLRITGENRNLVKLNGNNGQFEMGLRILVDRVLVENMTGSGYSYQPFYWGKTYRPSDPLSLGVRGYWGRYLTAHNNGLYGIYAFDARCGQIDNSYASGQPDAGFYIGECYPCDAVITDIVAEHNALGYSGTNAGGNLTLRNSTWRNNGLGIVPNSLDGEDRPPQRGITISHNLVENNNEIGAPASGLAGQYWGGGIVIAGGSANHVYGNTVTGHALAGMVLSPLPDQNLWISSNNTFWGNDVSSTIDGSFDLVQGAGSGPGNCWTDNHFATSAPPLIEDIYSCAFPTTPAGGDPRLEIELLKGTFGQNGRTNGDWKTYKMGEIPWSSFAQLPDETGDGNYANDGEPDRWLPALGR